MNLVQLKLRGGFLKAYVLDFNAQMNATPKMHKFSRKMYVFRWISKVGGGYFVQFPMFFKDMAGIIKITKGIEADGPKSAKSLGHHTTKKNQVEGTSSNKGDTQGGEPSKVENKEHGLVVPTQIMFVLREKCYK